MTQAPGVPPLLCLITNGLLILAIELSNTSWVLAASDTWLPGVKAKRSHRADSRER